ncbi:hypothetical protein TEPIDINF_000202 [Tepidibacillus infernus]|uniref:hypothetical protein n=1 Tax=Tepidibacillus infernus TaxID=1806172 RepID=UPI003A11A600
MSTNEIDQIVNRIRSVALKNKKVKKEHVSRIKNQVREKRDLEEKLICPKCGGKLVTEKVNMENFWDVVIF